MTDELDEVIALIVYLTVFQNAHRNDSSRSWNRTVVTTDSGISADMPVLVH